MDTPFEADAVMTGITLAYKNPAQALIAENVLPRKPVTGRAFSWTQYTMAQGYGTLHACRPPRYGTYLWNQRDATTSSVQDYGIDIPIDAHMQEKAERAQMDVGPYATQLATDIILLGREVRVANILGNKQSYPTKNRRTLTAAEQFSDAKANVIEILRGAIDHGPQRKNTLVTGQDVLEFIDPPKGGTIRFGSTNASGQVTKEQLASYLGIEKILVGQSKVNTQKRNLEPDLQAAWGNFIAVIYQNNSATPELGGVTFGMTAEYGQRIAGPISVNNMGVRGGTKYRVAESVGEIITAPDAGCLLQEVIKPDDFE